MKRDSLRASLGVGVIILFSHVGNTFGTGAALSFDGVIQYVGIEGLFPGLFPSVANNFTMELWVNPTGARAPTPEANSGITGTSGQRYAIFPAHGETAYGSPGQAGAGISVGNNGVTVFEHSTSYLPALLAYTGSVSGWTHVAVVYSNSQPRLYLNGALVRTGQTSTKVVHPSANLAEIGYFYGPYQGSLDEVRLWGAALDQATIQYWLNHELNPSHPAVDKLLGCWHLDENAGTTAFDSSGFGHSGRLYNGPVWVPGVPLIPSVAMTFPATNVLGDSARLNGLVNPMGQPTTAWFEWGTSSYTAATAPQNAGTGQAVIPISQDLSGLLPDTIYHFRCVATNASGQYFGADRSFQTGGPPSAQTQPATGVSIASSTLNALVNPDSLATAAWFDWGTNLTFENHSAVQTVAPGSVDVPLTNLVTGLTPGAHYYFRVVATNGSGSAVGAPLEFKSLFFSNSLSGADARLPASVAWGDYTRDGFPDLLATGGDQTNARTLLYEGDGGSFTLVPGPPGNPFGSAGLPATQSGAALWGDFDNDGALDVLVVGYTNVWYNGGPTTQICRNANGLFTNVAAGLLAVGKSCIAASDYDNDGFLDFVVAGTTGQYYEAASPTNMLYRNQGDGTFTNVLAGLPAVFDGAVAWGDFDNDGQLDLVIMGNAGTSNLTRIYRNDHGSFADIGANLPGVCCGSVAWGDYDNDGRLDLLLVGQTNSEDVASGICCIYRNDQGVFSDIGAGLPGLAMGAGAWGDFDGDGYLDILLGGYDNSLPGYPYQKTSGRIYRNDHGMFTDAQASLEGYLSCSVAWGDYDQDGRLDLVLVGQPYGLKVYRNFLAQPAVNPFAPTPPVGLVSTVLNSRAVLTWTAGGDGHTPSAGLTYNVRVGTASGGGQILAPHSDAVTGKRGLPQMGNAEHRLFTTVTNLPVGTYFWSVQTVNNSYAGSAWAPERVFLVTSGPPVTVTLPASNILCCSALLTGMVTPGGLPAHAWFEWGPTNGPVDHTPALDLGTGVVLQPVQAAIAGLEPFTSYTFRVVATNQAGLSVGTNQVFTTEGPAPLVETLGATNVSYTGATLLGVSPLGSAAADRFIEWGLTPAYGNSAPGTVINSAVQLDGVDDVVAMGWGAYPQVTNDFTLELWANPTGSRLATSESVSGTAATTGQQYVIFPEEGAMGYASAVHAGVGISVGTNGVSVAEHTDGYLPTVLVHTGSLSGWTHIALTYSNHVPRLYLNGGLTRVGLASSKIVHPSVGLGGVTNAPANGFFPRFDYGQFRGAIQDFRLWDTALNSTTIQTWMNQELTGSHPDFPHLQGHWPLNEGGGPTVMDLSPRANSGALLNGTFWTAGRGSTEIVFGAPLAGLAPGTTYHFRAGATNPGGAAFGSDQTFMTAPLPRVLDFGMQPGPGFHLYFTGAPNSSLFVEASTDLVSWAQLSNLPPGRFEFLDTGVSNWPTRFYRLRVP